MLDTAPTDLRIQPAITIPLLSNSLRGDKHVGKKSRTTKKAAIQGHSPTTQTLINCALLYYITL